MRFATVMLALLALAIGCAFGPGPAPRPLAPMPARRDGVMATGDAAYDGFFLRAAEVERKVAAAEAQQAALHRPLALALDLPVEARAEDVVAALREVARQAALSGARFTLVAGEPGPADRSDEPRLVQRSKAPIEPRARLILDATVETVRLALTASAGWGAMRSEIDALRREAEKLVAGVPKRFPTKRRGARFGKAVVAELQSRWLALGAQAKRAAASSDASTSLVAQLRAASST